MKQNLLQKGIFGLLWNYVSKIITYLTAFLLVVITSRGLSSESYGLYVLVLTVINFCLMLNFGFEDILNKYLPRYNVSDKINETQIILKNLFMLRLFTSIAISLILFFFSDYISNLLSHPEITNYLRIGSVYFLFANLTQLYRFVLIGNVNIKPITKIDSLIGIFVVVLTYSLISLGYGIEEILWVLTFTSIASYFSYKKVCKMYFVKKYEGYTEKFNHSPLYRYGINMWIIAIASFVLGSQTDIFLLNYYTHDLSTLGYYNISYTLSRNLGTVVTIGLSGVLLSIYAEVHSKYGNQKLSEIWSLNIKILVVLITPVVFFSIYYGQSLIVYIFSSSYLPATKLFQLYSLFFYVSWVLGGGANMTLMMIIDKEYIIVFTRIMSGILNILLNIILIPPYGAIGAIIATGFSTIIVILLERFVLLKYIPLKYPTLFSIKIIVAALLSLVPLMYAKVSIILGLLIYSITLITILRFIKPFELEESKYIESMSPRIHKIFKKFQKSD